VVRALIEAGADVNKARECGWTPIYVAAEQGHGAIVRVLIDAGADVNEAREEYGWTPLFANAYNSHEAIVRALIEAGADVDKARDNGDCSDSHRCRRGARTGTLYAAGTSRF
jgi:ankyrin repeat protein